MAGHAAAPEEPLSDDGGAHSVTNAERVDAEDSNSTTQVDEEAIDGDGAESAPDTEVSPAPDADGTDAADSTDTAEADGEAGRKPRARRLAPVRLALVFGVVAFVAVGTLSGWLGYRDYQSAKLENQRHQFLQVARQGAINLTTIDWQEADADIQRILAGATGSFYDDFSQRAQPFIEVVKQVKSKSVGAITLAGLESYSGHEAQALVAVNVKTTTAQAPDPQARAWRMRLTVQQAGNDMKVSNVEFVP